VYDLQAVVSLVYLSYNCVEIPGAETKIEEKG